MTRYYIDTEKGPAPRPERPAALACVYAYPDDHKGPLQPKYTEVRIVPVDAIVIERSELPEVTEDEGDYVVRVFIGECWYGPEGASKDADPNVSRARALAHLALAEHIAAHPPVDEEQVDALTVILYGLDGTDSAGPVLARRLVERGVRVEANR